MTSSPCGLGSPKIPNMKTIARAIKGYALGALVLAGAAIAAIAANPAQAQIRVGPVDPENGFPLWYEDETGLRLDLCTDLTNCFFFPPDPVLPATFPTNFPDEAFYWAAEAFIEDGAGTKAILIMAREAAFLNDGVVDGDQIVFSRLRFYIDGAPIMIGNEYKITHPYGVETFVSKPGDAGPGAQGEGYSATHDVGITTAGEFKAAMSVYPTFLIPASMNRDTLKATPGGLLDTTGGVDSTAVQGSPLGTNFFRIEGPNIGDVYPGFACADATLGGVLNADGTQATNDCVETYQFAIMGRVASRFGVEIDKASYDKVDSAPEDPLNNDPITYVNVWAHTVEGQTIAARVDGGPQVYLTEGAGGNYFGRLASTLDFALADPMAKPGSIQVMNLTDSPSLSQTKDITTNIAITSASWDVATGTLQVQAQSSDLYNTPSLTVDFEPASMPLTENSSTSGAGLQTTTYSAGGAGAGGPSMPPIGVRVTSLDGGTVLAPVTITGGYTGGGQVETLQANAGADKVVNAGAVVNLNGAGSTGPIANWSWSTTNTDVSWTCVDLPVCSQIEITTPDEATMTLNGQDQIVATFTLTVQDANLVSSSDSATVTVTNPSTLANDTCTVTIAEYRDGSKDFWRVTGTSDIADLQRVFVYLGGDVFDPTTLKLVGETRVDALGLWELRTPRRSATTDGTVPGAGDTKLWIESERGCLVSSSFIVN